MYPKRCPLWLRKCHTCNAKLPAEKRRRCPSNFVNRGNLLMKTKVMA
jgi:hypothetical protein